MFTISLDHMSQLGDGVLIPDGDTLYMYGGSWLLVVTGCEHHIPIEILRLVANAPGGALTDWGVLNAKKIVEKEKKFIPGRGNGSREVYVRDSKYHSVSPEGIRGLIESNADCLWGSCYKLDQLFGAGQARTKYVREDAGDRRKFSIEPTAEEYVFELDGRLLAVSPNIIRPFYEMEFDVNCPTVSSGYPKVLGMYSRVHTPDVFGYFAPRLMLRDDSDDKKLYVDAASCSWYSPEEGRDKLTKFGNYLPGVLDQAIRTIRLTEDLKYGISILRWYGASDEEIETLYQEGRPAGIAKQADELLDEIRAECAAGNVSAWKMQKLERSVSEFELELGGSFQGRQMLGQLRRVG